MYSIYCPITLLILAIYIQPVHYVTKLSCLESAKRQYLILIIIITNCKNDIPAWKTFRTNLFTIQPADAGEIILKTKFTILRN